METTEIRCGASGVGCEAEDKSCSTAEVDCGSSGLALGADGDNPDGRVDGGGVGRSTEPAGATGAIFGVVTHVTASKGSNGVKGA
ncbi:hypothetical protein NDU88_000998 [Pleurodeles waltl]|uniref:Uncharacterized protein n=1 Tax=Pleurodeles waltl TaxID=8319 RepID=A0AAV7S9H5_PLEWA|nr:hypothetical protein NDU88_000998 [Pleurodeles waltl]